MPGGTADCATESEARIDCFRSLRASPGPGRAYVGGMFAKQASPSRGLAPEVDRQIVDDPRQPRSGVGFGKVFLEDEEKCLLYEIASDLERRCRHLARRTSGAKRAP